MPEPTYSDDYYAHLRDRADAVAAELHRAHGRLRELVNDPQRRDLDAEHVRGETIGLRNALGILTNPPGSTPTQRFIEHVGDNYYENWRKEQAHADGTHLYCGMDCLVIKARVEKQDAVLREANAAQQAATEPQVVAYSSVGSVFCPACIDDPTDPTYLAAPVMAGTLRAGRVCDACGNEIRTAAR
ncbi:hypothetical protein [Streptomyces sp. NPDC059916]|uniref:hypothetical protein n=1 Tax=Streptomyces sp. NPDC059916 TaxID=3347001 RepID=UPI0036B65AC8